MSFPCVSAGIMVLVRAVWFTTSQTASKILIKFYTAVYGLCIVRTRFWFLPYWSNTSQLYIRPWIAFPMHLINHVTGFFFNSVYWILSVLNIENIEWILHILSSTYCVLFKGRDKSAASKRYKLKTFENRAYLKITNSNPGSLAVRCSSIDFASRMFHGMGERRNKCNCNITTNVRSIFN